MCVRVCVRACVRLLSHISPLERLFVLKILSRTQRATEVKTFVGFSLKPLGCRDPELKTIRTVAAESMHAYLTTRTQCVDVVVS